MKTASDTTPNSKFMLCVTEWAGALRARLRAAWRFEFLSSPSPPWETIRPIAKPQSPLRIVCWLPSLRRITPFARQRPRIPNCTPWTFHIGGAASRVVKRSQIMAGHDGHVRLMNVRLLKNKDNAMVVVSRNAEIFVREENGKERDQ